MEDNRLPSAALKKTLLSLLSGLLWLVSAILALVSIFAARDLLMWVLTLLLLQSSVGSYDGANALSVANDCGSLLLGIASITAIIISSEYFFKHSGQPRVFRLLFMIIAAECALIIPAAIFFWRP